MSTTSIPDSIKVNTLSKFIDWTDEKSPTFKFMVEIRNGDKRMVVDYSGGVLAFIDWEDHENELEQIDVQDGEQITRYIREIRRGKFPTFHPNDSNDVASSALRWIFERSFPSKEQILHSMILDSECVGMNFEEFCEEFGYNNDSIKVENIWKLCVKQGRDFQKLLGNLYQTVKNTLEYY